MYLAEGEVLSQWPMLDAAELRRARKKSLLTHYAFRSGVCYKSDFIITDLALRCKRPLIPAEIRLNRADLRRIGATPSAGNPYISGAERGAAREDRTLGLSLTNVTPRTKNPGNSAKSVSPGTERSSNRGRTE